MNSLLENRILPISRQGTAQNSTNGCDAESFAAANLILATRSEISWGSREEDGRKIDLFLSCDHPWFSKERIIILCQVKSGQSYGEMLNRGFNLKKAAYVSAQRTTHSILVLWVNRDENLSFWAYIHPNSKYSRNGFGSYHKITPATYFDLARCVSREMNITEGGKGVTIRKRNTDYKLRRRNVYDSYSGVQSVFCPVLGKVEVTRLGWRHMFRKGRAKKFKESSLDCIPYIKKILAQKPTEHAITSIDEWDKNNFSYRKAEHLLKFDKVTISSPEEKNREICVVARILEEIRYPCDWTTSAMMSQCIERRVVLRTIYHKPKG
ncbi:hypothetical protein ACEWBL_23425 [Vibrio parahaemolyticus]